MANLECKGITKSFGTKQVLKGIDLTIESGKIYGLIGRNGFSWNILLPLILLLLGIIFLVGAATLRYQKRAMIFYAVLYFVIILFMSRIPRVLKPFIAFLRDVDLPYHILGPVVMILIGLAALAGSWLLIRRQDVRV